MKPVIGFPSRAAASKEVIFDGSQTQLGDADIVGYEWNFGDGGTASGPVVVHTYTSPGIYNVTLTVTNDADFSSTSDPVQISIVPLYSTPVLYEPADGIQSEGRLPPLFWDWGTCQWGQDQRDRWLRHEPLECGLAEDEYFEVRIWLDGEPYHYGIAWVKEPVFDFNLEGFTTGRYHWSIAIARSDQVVSKGWPGIDAWEGKGYIAYLSDESEIRSFFLIICGKPDRHGNEIC
ncbi:MAG: hypothetical protein Kow0063_44020 [Anaerolineae bacterium]